MTWSPEKQDRMDELMAEITNLKTMIGETKTMGERLHQRNVKLESAEKEYLELRAERAFFRVEGMERNGA